jgi:diguanylate cyclase (GGDEF)-like protein
MTMLGASMGTMRRERPTPPGAAGAAWHTAAAEELATAGRWKQAYRHLRTAVRLLNGQPGGDELDRPRREHTEAREQSRRDSLTATYNRRYLDERLGALVGEPGRGVGAPGIAVALLDVDHFKQINDTYGHPFGDRVLQRLVAVLDSSLPDGAFCARHGGEEFAIVLPGHDRHEAVRVCETARERVDRHLWPELAPGLNVTVSIGLAHGFGPVTGHDGLIAAADRLLDAAKHAGRNSVAFHDAHTGHVRLAGPEAGRRSIPQPPVAAPH